MGFEEILEQVKMTVRNIVPSNIELTNIEFEGPEVVIYTMNLEAFANNNNIIKQLAQGLRKRVAIRPDPSILMDTDTAETEIRKIIPEDAEITDIYFDVDSGEATIEAKSPGLAIGKHGIILNEIKRQIGWVPKVVRTPPIPSKTIREIRGYLRSVAEERKEFLRQVGRRIHREIVSGENWVRNTNLGGYREVGRSCTLLTTRHTKVLIDCGINVASEDNGTPYLDVPEVLPLETIDCIIVTHAHLDHSGLVPLLYKYGYDGPTYCTLPTRDLMSLLQLDYLRVAVSEGRKTPFESSHIREVVKHCITLRYGDTTDIAPDIRLTLQNAGHILGSAIAHLHIGDGLHNVAFTGDIKFEKTWLFNPAICNFPRLETLVIESTYGSYQDLQPSRREAADQLKRIIERTLARGGHVLIPVFAVGRSQEVMMVLEQLMRFGEIQEIPVYLDGMIMEATAIHTAYPEYLNNQLRTQIFQRGENPFLSDIFKHVDSTEMREKICNNPEPCLVLATSGMLNGGPVMEYIKCWGPDARSTLIFVGYQSEGTLGRRIQRGLTEIPFNEGGKTIIVELKMNVETCDGFSGHSDRRQLFNFLFELQPRPERIIMCHGENTKCTEFAASVYKRYGVETHAPMNLETLRFK
jgi:hypothetical protein